VRANKLTILISALLITAGRPGLYAATFKYKPTLLQDGFVIAGLDGELSQKGDDGEWFVKFDKTIVDDKGQIIAGEFIQLLLASALEKITLTAKKNAPLNIRLWGRVTRYDNKNFIFPTYFLPLAEGRQKRPESSISTPSLREARPGEPNINEPGDTIVLPEEVLRKLRTKRPVKLAQLRMGLESKEDEILTERIGFILKPNDSPYCVFRLDALGRNLEDISFRLLPCEALEKASITRPGGIARYRYKITGILTKYKGQDYLLPQRATRVFSHGNFAR
jgi:hypothetical protein